MSGRLEPGLPVTVAAGVTRLVAPNPSMMTGPGTNSYVLGRNGAVVIDPGPAIDRHIDALCELAPAAHAVIVTHTHPDHSPGVRLLAEATGAEVLGMPAPRGAHQDSSFRPTRVLADGDVLETGEFALEALHTPGHASNHLCFRHAATNWILTGDHVIDGSTVVIDPPDGDMTHYLRSLERVKACRPEALLPGHGEKIDDPVRVIDWIIGHRLEREAKVLAALTEKPGSTARELVPAVYADVPEKLHAWAERSLIAHLLKLRNDGVATSSDERWRRAQA